MIDLELIIKQFIRTQISQLKARDEEYALEYLKNEFDKHAKYLINDRLIDGFYHRYRLGQDVFKILDKKSYYANLPVSQFPMIYKVEPPAAIQAKHTGKGKKLNNNSDDDIPFDLTSIELPPNITLIEEQISKLKIEIIRKAKRFIAIKELQRWINENGLKLPIIDKEKYLVKRNDQAHKEENGIKMTIDNCLIELRENKKIDELNYNKLFDLLYNFFESRKSPVLKTKIIVKYGSKKRLASALGAIYRELDSDTLKDEYIILAKNNINIYASKEIKTGTLRKYFYEKSK